MKLLKLFATKLQTFHIKKSSDPKFKPQKASDPHLSVIIIS